MSNDLFQRFSVKPKHISVIGNSLGGDFGYEILMNLKYNIHDKDEMSRIQKFLDERVARGNNIVSMDKHVECRFPFSEKSGSWIVKNFLFTPNEIGHYLTIELSLVGNEDL